VHRQLDSPMMRSTVEKKGSTQFGLVRQKNDDPTVPW
jgi:hypothetical protein